MSETGEVIPEDLPAAADTECSWCNPIPSSLDDCAARGSEAWPNAECTRERGHADEHIACGLTTHDVHRWPAEPAP